jgi:hypothetical protein
MPKLNPPIPQSELKITKGTLNYGIIKSAKPALRHGKVTSQFIDKQPDLDQGEIGSCTGHAGSYWYNACHWFLCPSDIPTAEEITEFVRDSTVMVYNSCKMTYDKMYKGCFSPWWIYKLAQWLGGLPWQTEGAYSIDVAKGLSKYGAVTWDTCLTPKFPTCAPSLYPAPGSTEEEQFKNMLEKAAVHKFDGFATETDWEILKEAIADSGGRGCILATNLYDNYMDLDNNGCFRNKPGGEVVGSHELWCYEVDFDGDNGNGIIRFKNSWLKACQFPGMKKDYFSDCAGPAYIAIDSADVIIGKQKYTKLIFVVKDSEGNTVDCKFTIDGVIPKDTYIESGIPHVCRAIPKTLLVYKEPYQEVTVTGLEIESEKVVTFPVFNKIPKPEPSSPKWPKWAEDLFQWLKKKLKKTE